MIQNFTSTIASKLPWSKLYLLQSIILIGILSIISSCDRNFDQINTKPSAATSIDPGYLFSTVLLETSGRRYENWRATLIYSSTMIQHLAALPDWWSGDKYLYNAQYSGAYMEQAYKNQVKNLVDVLNRTEDDPSMNNRHQIARIWKVLVFQRITDLYGDVPYFEAGKGYTEEIYTPVYVDQASIYLDMLHELDQAVDLIDLQGDSFEGADFIFDGDLQQWQRFGNSLMLRLALRISNVAPTVAQEYAEKAIAKGLMQSNLDMAYLKHTDGPESINMNGIGEVFAVDNNPRLSETFVNWLKDHHDPRLNILAIPGMQGHVGLPNGFDSGTILEHDSWGEDGMAAYSTVNPLLVDLAAPMLFMTYAEVEFLLAEAALKGYTGAGDPVMHYEAGVAAAMEFYTIYDESLGIDQDAITSYLVQNPFDGSAAMIHEQYWAVTFLNDMESWANWRRTGYPELVPVDYPGNVTNGQMPRRLKYFEREYSLNSTNILAASARMGGDEMSTRVWWDVE